MFEYVNWSDVVKILILISVIYTLSINKMSKILPKTKLVAEPLLNQVSPLMLEAETQLKGGLTNYYLVHVAYPQREDQLAYKAECEDIIDALNLTFDEANIFKEIWRSANARKNNGKPGHSALYGAQKIVHYAKRILRKQELEAAEVSTAVNQTFPKE